MDSQKARAIGEDLSGDYAFAEPFPHITIEKLLPNKVAESLLQNFPREQLSSDTNYIGEHFEHNKRQILPNACNEQALSHFLFFNSAPFLQFLEGISGISGLIPDPYFLGGGFHEISNGGKLGIHADFRLHTKLNLERRLNVLIYLNKNWIVEYGGNLELWNKQMTQKVKDIEPIFNRCVIFSTDADSYHGHPDPLTTPKDITRKSLALYYYTASKAVLDEIPNVSTNFQARTNLEAIKVVMFNIKHYTIPFVMNEILPPILTRKIKNMRKRLKKNL